MAECVLDNEAQLQDYIDLIEQNYKKLNKNIENLEYK